jgi:alpha-ketoglutarate-dependent taurine dioxygenase
MEPLNADQISFQRFRTTKRTTVTLSAQHVVTTRVFDERAGLPLLVEPAVDQVNLASWIAGHREIVETHLLRCGALLFRGFAVESGDAFERVACALGPELMTYTERAAPRKQVGGRVYTSTEYPATHPIPLHHEMSYSHNWPAKIWFYCARPAQERGGTPIASDRQVFARLDAAMTRPFIDKKVMYVRNYGEGVDLTWQEAFQTEDRAVVEAYCRATHTTFEWRDANRLRTRQVRQAVAVHPKTGETVWFNHAHMFHISNVDPIVRGSLLAEFAPDELPRNAFYGDGSPIDDDVLAEIRAVYDREAVTFPWQQQDVLLLDNFLVSHGREPFVGPRSVLVAMTEQYTNDIPVASESL